MRLQALETLLRGVQVLFGGVGPFVRSREFGNRAIEFFAKLRCAFGGDRLGLIQFRGEVFLELLRGVQLFGQCAHMLIEPSSFATKVAQCAHEPTGALSGLILGRLQPGQFQRIALLPLLRGGRDLGLCRAGRDRPGLQRRWAHFRGHLSFDTVQ